MPDQNTVALRDVIPSDLPIFFDMQRDPDANFMAAFTSRDPSDRQAFDLHWAKIMNDETVVNKTILYNGEIAGNIAKFIMFGQPEIGYWIRKEFWGKGIATQALAAFLEVITMRPTLCRCRQGQRRITPRPTKMWFRDYRLRSRLF